MNKILRFFLTILLSIISNHSLYSQHLEKKSDIGDILCQTIYNSYDSLHVVELLQQELKVDENEVIFYARQFLGFPYVAHTLEKADPEKLVVNLRQLDCTTFVETVLALAMTKRQKCDSFSAYCYNLMQLRYRGGYMSGYLSRLHYFSWWMEDNLRRNHMTLISHPKYFTHILKVNNTYMSTHSVAYRFLKGNKERVDSIQRLEQRYNGKVWKYIPPEALETYGNTLASVIHEGDVIALVTAKKGLDFSHLGFAVWGKDDCLHLLNASSLHHEVVDEPKTLQQYIREHPSCLGFCVLRLTE